MKYHQIDRDLFIKNREKIHGSDVKPKSVAIFNSMIFIPFRR
jgi:Xaa-Pro aminopeptidase